MSQINLFELNEGNKSPFVVKTGLNVVENGEFLFYPDFFPKQVSDNYFQKLKNNVDWKQESMNVYGKKIPFPRLTSWYGDQNKTYTFSGVTLQPNTWLKELIEIKSLIETIAKIEFNSVLLNLYRNGNDSISWHTDAEKELGNNPIIGSVNFGETRLFQLRHRKTKERIEFNLRNGSLLIMRGELQHYWQHQVPKTSKFVKERINLTFRVLI